MAGVTGEAGHRYRVGYGEPDDEWSAELDAWQQRDEKYRGSVERQRGLERQYNLER